MGGRAALRGPPQREAKHMGGSEALGTRLCTLQC